MIQVYFRISTIGPYQLPYTSYAGGRPNVIQFLAKLNRIFLLRNNLDINVETGHIHLSSALEYRYVLIPGVVSGGRVTSGPASGYSRSELMAMSYEQITALFNIPPEGIGLILAIDVFCDMGRTMTNVLGNALATAAVSKWEGELAHAPHHQFDQEHKMNE